MQSANNAAIAGDAKLQTQNDITLLGGTLQTQNDIVKYSDGGENWVQIMATGETYDADNCEQPILAGYSDRCMVCGASDIEYAELIGTDGTTKRMLETSVEPEHIMISDTWKMEIPSNW